MRSCLARGGHSAPEQVDVSQAGLPAPGRTNSIGTNFQRCLRDGRTAVGSTWTAKEVSRSCQGRSPVARCFTWGCSSAPAGHSPDYLRPPCGDGVSKERDPRTEPGLPFPPHLASSFTTPPATAAQSRPVMGNGSHVAIVRRRSRFPLTRAEPSFARFVQNSVAIAKGGLRALDCGIVDPGDVCRIAAPSPRRSKGDPVRHAPLPSPSLGTPPR